MGNRASCAEAPVGGGRPEIAFPPITAEPPPSPPAKEEGGVRNPGDYEDLGKSIKEQVLPQLFDGCKMVIHKGLSQHFQTMHTLTLGSSTMPSQWQFGGTYVGTKLVAENDYRPIMIGDISSCGNFTAILLHQLGSAWKIKCNLQTQKSRWVGWQGSVDYKGGDFTASFTLANPDIISGSGVMVLQYLQAMTSRLSLGTELLYQRGGGMQTALVSVGGSYKTEEWEACARLGMHAWQVAYQHKLKDLTLVAECDGNLMQGETVAAVGYRMVLGSLTVKGKVDSHGSVGTTVEKRLDPLPASLLLSGQLNHWTDESKFGVALMIG